MTIALITGLISDLVNLLLGLIGVEKESLKTLLEQWHLIYFWDSARTIFGVTFVLGLAGALVLEKVAGRLRSRAFSASFWQGFWFHVLNIAILGAVLASALSWVHWAYITYLPFLDVRVLSQYSHPVQFVLLFVIQDFVRYVRHWTLHKVPLFWVFHAVHHSDSEVGPTTDFRSHIGEKVLGSLLNTGPFMILGADPAVILTLVLLEEFWTLFLHSSARIRLGPIERFVITPCFHRLHHSKEPHHWDKNYGTFFTVWDRAFGTASMDYDSSFETGIAEYGRADPASSSIQDCVKNWAWLTIRPFLDIARGGWRTRSPEIYGAPAPPAPEIVQIDDAAVGD